MLKPLEVAAIILPTRDLVNEYKLLDPRFFFYRGGVKGLICDAVVMTNGSALTTDGQSNLVGSMVEDYTQYELECLHSNVPLPDDMKDLTELELIVDLIEEDVQKFLDIFFSGQQFEILKFIQWVEDDLMVYARIF